MRTIAAGDSQILTASSAERGARVRVSVKDSGGTFRDLTTYPEEDFVEDVSWQEDVDSPGLTASVTLRRAVGDKSLAPLHEASPLNRQWGAAGYAALLELGREVKIEAGVTRDLEGTPDNWLEVFRGYIDIIDWGGEVVSLECAGLQAKLRDTWIETERVYAHAQGAAALKGLRPFELNRAYVLNELVLPSEGTLNGHYYKVTTAGTTSSTVEPTWPTGGASTVTSGTVTFTEAGTTSTTVGTAVQTVMQQILDDNGLSAVSLYTPTSPGWAIRGYLQQRESVWDALSSLAQQIGWELRFIWDSGTSAFRLTLRDVNRAKTTPDATIAAAELVEVAAATKEIAAIRNAVRVVYSDSGNRVPGTNEPIRAVVEVSDATSITKYGRRFCEIAESANSNIDTSTEATALANAVLSDLKEPNFDWAVTLRFYPWLQVADLLRFLPNNRHFSSQQDLALVSVAHSVSASRATTEVRTRGKPSTGHAKWLAREGRVIPADVHQLTGGNPGGTATLTPVDTVAGQRFIFTHTAQSAYLPIHQELHVSDSSGFTPSGSTMKSAGQHSEVTVTDLVPGKTYYAKTVPYRRNASRLVRGLPSAEVSFVAGRAKAGHLVADVDWGRVPLNGSFETQTDSGGPPDHWVMTNGTWGTEIQLGTGSGAVTGDTYLSIISGTTQRGIETDFFEVVGTHDYSLEAFAKGISGTGSLKVSVQWYLYDLSYDSENGLLFDATATSWAEQRDSVTPPAGVKFGKIKIYKDAPTTAGAWHVDSVRFVDVGEAWIAPTYNSSWVDVGGAWMTGGYYRDPRGVIRLRGLAKWNAGGPLAATIFTLPVGYRPSASLQYPVRMGTGVLSYLSIDSAGVVQYGGGVLADAQGGITLDGVSFDTR